MFRVWGSWRTIFGHKAGNAENWKTKAKVGDVLQQLCQKMRPHTTAGQSAADGGDAAPPAGESGGGDPPDGTAACGGGLDEFLLMRTAALHSPSCLKPPSKSLIQFHHWIEKRRSQPRSFRGPTLSLPRVINFKFLLQPHQKYYITEKRTWLFVAYSDERLLCCQFSLPHLRFSLKGWENILFLNLGVKGLITLCFEKLQVNRMQKALRTGLNGAYIRSRP